MAIQKRYMMATVAHHGLGNISREEPDLCHVKGEDGDDYIGNWIEGYGFMGVRFPKATTRELTEDEKRYYHGRALTLGEGRLGGLILIPDAPNALPIPEQPLVIHTKNSVYRLGQPNMNGVRAIIKDGDTLTFDWCVIKSLVLERPLVVMGLHEGNPIIPLSSTNVVRIEECSPAVRSSSS